MTARKLFLLAASATVLVVLFAVLRPDDGGDSAGGGTAAATTTPATTATTPETTTAVTTTTPTTTRDDVVRSLLVVDVSEPIRPRTLKVAEGRRVVLTVRVNAVDEVHLHGYDVVRRVAPGSPARLAFDADLAGVFEVELEERHQLIAELEVRP